MNKWVPYYLGDAPDVRILAPNPDTYFELTGTGIGQPVSENDVAYVRYYMVGIGQDMNYMVYDDNTSCVPVYTMSFGNTPYNAGIRNFDSGFRGYHRYTLAYFSNYVFKPVLTSYIVPGLYGMIMG